MQDLYLSRFLNYANGIFAVALDPDDMISLYQAKKILKSSRYIYDNVTMYLSENNAANAIFIAINLGNVVYQYVYASWFLNLTTTFSGIRKLYRVIFQNPILGIFFYLSFYFRILGETDKKKFNHVARFFNISEHDDFLGKPFIGKFAERTASFLTGFPILLDYKHDLKNIIQKVFSETLLAELVAGVPVNVTKLMQSAAIDYANSTKRSDAVYIPRTVETQRDFDEFLDYLTNNKRDIERNIKKTVGGKKKNRRKLELKRQIEKKFSKGEVNCLNDCKSRQKTTSGCYCDGNCGSTTFFGGKSWCFVDPTTCKNGKHLRKFFGKSYDTCNVLHSNTPMCYTGVKYRNCRTIN
jgi:hypothetical protein